MRDIIVVSDSAAKKIVELADVNKPLLRVSVKSGGCSGLMYDLSFDDSIGEGDIISESNGVKILCDKKSSLYLIGTELDYSGGLNGKGFVFNNPQALRSCGCGESFSL